MAGKAGRKSLPFMGRQMVFIRCSDDVRHALEHAAKDDTRDFSGLARMIVVKWLQEKGYLDERCRHRKPA